MRSSHDFDLCVLGAGSAGYAAATTARSMGKSVALVDGTAPLAGLCILRGCMPSKTLLRSAEIAHLTRIAPALGVHPGDVRVDVGEIVRRKDRIIADFADDRVNGIKKFPLFLGAPRFVSRSSLVVGQDRIRARRFVVATGSIIDVPPIPGLHETGFLTSDDVLNLTRLPASVIVLGGGATAVELAQYLARVGAHVTVVQRSETLLSCEDPDVGAALRSAFEGEGIVVRTGTRLVQVERAGERKRVRFESNGVEEAVEADEVFAALGRKPNVDGFGLDAAGIAYDRGGVKTDRYLRTSNPHIFAAGDVTGAYELVHVAVYGGQLAARNAFTRSPKPINYDLIAARAVFTDPQVAVAGLTERELTERHIAYEKASFPFDDLG
ncbi:MAG TPA: FAD-dependent oxidoreductase, partial [Candidatus Acidoferrales bacterium]|nr:FAD-dependent oxidoreductase [Candidatus Acidoferrales bacterium]